MLRRCPHPRACLLALAVLCGGGAAWAEPPKKPAAVSSEREGAAKQAMALNDEAWALYEQGRYRAAIAKLEEAVRLDPGGKDLVYNLALIHEKLARFDEAAVHYKRYLEMETDPKAKGRVQAIVKRLEGAQREEGVTPAPGAPVREAAPPPPPPARPVKAWVVATGSIAGSAFLVGSIFALSAVARNPGSNARTGDGVTIDDLQRDARVAHTNAMVADIAFILAAAAAGTATILYFTTPRAAAPSERSPAGAKVAIGPGALRVSW